jgi:hypothetical protein
VRLAALPLTVSAFAIAWQEQPWSRTSAVLGPMQGNSGGPRHRQRCERQRPERLGLGGGEPGSERALGPDLQQGLRSPEGPTGPDEVACASDEAIVA